MKITIFIEKSHEKITLKNNMKFKSNLRMKMLANRILN